MDARNSYSVDALRELSRRRLPRMIFDFVDGGSDDEITCHRNVSRFDDIEFLPRVLRPVSEPDMSVDLFGHKLSLPIVVAPTGLSGMLWPHGEVQVARACAKAGSIMTVSHATTIDLPELANCANNPIWFQTLIYKDREMTRAIVQRARDAGYHGLVLTVDLQALGQRERDIRNHFTVPPAITVRNCVDALCHPRWLVDYLRQPELTMAVYAAHSGGEQSTDLATLATHMSKLFVSDVSWDDVAWLRDQWDGPLLLKGVLHPNDAIQARSLNLDGIIISNHGGRQLDTAITPITALPTIKDAVGDDLSVLMCSGIRRGTHVVKALALGASAVLIGRAHLWGLASGGEAGVSRVFDLLGEEIRRTMIMGGWSKISEIDNDALVKSTIPPLLQ